MLPFLKDKQDGSVSMPIESMESMTEEGHEFDALEGAMSELHSAMNSKDYQHAAQIFRSAVELLDSEPHKEGEHI
jgi:hypothetical protein